MNILLDLGAHKLQGVKYLYQNNCIDTSYIVYSYEANPYIFEELNKESKEFEHQTNIKIYTYNLAVSDVDGEILFNVDQNGLDSMGCNLLDNPVTEDPVYHSKYSWKKIKIPSVSLYTIFDSFDKKNLERIDVKMDIEGTEYKILPDLLKLKKSFNIKKLYIEWHDRLFYPNHKEKQNEMMLFKKQLTENNIEFIDNDYILL